MQSVVLRSESGDDYAPRTGQAARMQVYVFLPRSLILTAPAGAIFQKVINTPAGLDWLDLTQKPGCWWFLLRNRADFSACASPDAIRNGSRQPALRAALDYSLPLRVSPR
jgi:hypothetical protein